MNKQEISLEEKMLEKPSTDEEVREHWNGIISEELITSMIEYWRDEIKANLALQQKQSLAALREKINDLPSFPSQKRVKDFICKQEVLSLLQDKGNIEN